MRIISIHAPHEGERQLAGQVGKAARYISIHAPHEGERPSFGFIISLTVSNFNPRSPRGGATFLCPLLCRACLISIHAPHEGERHIIPDERVIRKYFNPRSPRGGATLVYVPFCSAAIFQSTLPTRGSDIRVEQQAAGKTGISIHAPHEGERPSSRR